MSNNTDLLDRKKGKTRNISEILKDLGLNWYFPNTTEFKRFNLHKSLAVIFVELYLELYDDYLS